MARIVVRRWTLLLLAVAVLAVAVLALAVTGAVLRARTGDPAPAGLGTRTVTAGAVDVKLTALSLDASGARFRVVMDAHSVDLGLNLPAAAQLRVNGSLTGPGAWAGSGPGGHHREGTLTFTTAVPAGAAVELRVTGLPADAAATWTAP